MKVTKLEMGYVATNTYILSEGDVCVVIDPCLDPKQDARKIERALQGKKVLAVLLTHGHFDHISAVDVLVKAYHCPVYMIHTGVHWPSKPLKNLSSQMPELVSIQSEITAIKTGVLEIGPFLFDVRLNPGHTDHDTRFVINDMAFVGDFIMKDTIGRTDLPTGSMAAMNKSIKEFIDTYSTIYIYPGHGDITTLEDELLNNPFLKPRT